jgi:hypothetical protein
MRKEGRKEGRGDHLDGETLLLSLLLCLHVWSMRFAVEIKGSHISWLEDLRSDLASMEKAATFQPIKGEKKTNVPGLFKRTIIY